MGNVDAGQKAEGRKAKGWDERTAKPQMNADEHRYREWETLIGRFLKPLPAR
jgi:hypothetical protein